MGSVKQAEGTSYQEIYIYAEGNCGTDMDSYTPDQLSLQRLAFSYAHHNLPPVTSDNSDMNCRNVNRMNFVTIDNVTRSKPCH